MTNEQLFSNPAAGRWTEPGRHPPFFTCNLNNQTCNYGRYYTLQRIGIAVP